MLNRNSQVKDYKKSSEVKKMSDYITIFRRNVWNIVFIIIKVVSIFDDQKNK